MWDGNDSAPAPKPVYINKARALRKAVQSTVKKLIQEWKEREKHENIRLLQMPIPDNGNTTAKERRIRVSSVQITIKTLR